MARRNACSILKTLFGRNIMAAKRKSILFIVMILVGWGVLAWTAAAIGINKIGSSPAFPFIVVLLALSPVYPLYQLAAQWPKLRIGLVSVVVGLVIAAIAAIAHYFLRIDQPWVDYMSTLGEILFFMSSLLLAWQGLRSKA
jgi:hypothetical protein